MCEAIASESGVADFVKYALRQQGRAGTREMVRWVFVDFDAYCAILWQLTGEGLDPATDSHLFAAVTWFPSKFWSRHDLPLHHSLAGWAILNKQVVQAPATDGRINPDSEFIKEHGVRWICA